MKKVIVRFTEISSTSKKLISIDDANIKQLRTVARFAGMDELVDKFGEQYNWAPDFINGDDLSVATTNKVKQYLKKRYKSIDITNPRFITVVK